MASVPLQTQALVMVPPHPPGSWPPPLTQRKPRLWKGQARTRTWVCLVRAHSWVLGPEGGRAPRQRSPRPAGARRAPTPRLPSALLHSKCSEGNEGKGEKPLLFCGDSLTLAPTPSLSGGHRPGLRWAPGGEQAEESQIPGFEPSSATPSTLDLGQSVSLFLLIC